MESSIKSHVLLIDRSKKLIETLKGELNKYFEERPYQKIIEKDFKNKQEIHKIKITKNHPNDIGVQTKEILSHLRDSLDYCVANSSESFGVIDPKRTSFPFAENKGDLEKKVQEKKNFGDVPKEIIDIILNLKPYKGGNALLFALNKARNISTHRMLIPFVGIASFQEMAADYLELKGTCKIAYNKWIPEKKELEFMRLGIDSKYKYYVSYHFDLLFADIEGIQNESLIPTLLSICYEVESATNAIDEEVLKKTSPST